MKVLHLFANHKFTGPADPALVLARALRDAGVEVTWAAGRSPDGGGGLLALGEERGLPVAPGLRLRKHGRPLPWLADVARLRRWLRERRFDVVHAHLPNDHHIAVTAARGLGVPVVRSLYDAEPPTGFRGRISVERSARLIAPTPAAADRLRVRYPAVAGRVVAIAPVRDLSRFGAPRDPAVRAGWGAGEGAFVVGVVARMQLHRRFGELIEGFAIAAREDRGLHLVVLGRGTHQRTVAHEPAARSGVGDRIHFPGYIEPARYPAVLPAFDALLFLVPGSDGTCRAVREAQASGVPVIAAPRGLLPELIAPGESGVLLGDDEPAAIASAIRALRADPARREALARGARRFAAERFDARAAAARVAELYSEAR
jgi:glycosyltransferase involved in cell wall biosynthesis